MIEAFPAARAVLTKLFGMRVLEESLTWAPKPGDASLTDDLLHAFRDGLRRLAPYLLARVGADRADERLARQDARKLRDFIDAVEPVTSLDLSCRLDDQELTVGEGNRAAFVDLSDERVQGFVVWGENAWPPDQHEAETLAGALCDVLGAGYFESFIALLRAESPALRERILRRAGAPVDIDDKRALFLTASEGDIQQDATSSGNAGDTDELKTAASAIGTGEEPAVGPTISGHGGDGTAERPRAPLYDPAELLIQGAPLIIVGHGAPVDDTEKRTSGGSHKTGPGVGSGRFGGNTDLDKLDALGMWVALSFEQDRLRRGGLLEATVFDHGCASANPHMLVFNVSRPELVESARSKSNQFHAAMKWLHESFLVVPDWPGFDILTLDSRVPNSVDRMIELKSSGVASRIQEMTWNEWKTAKTSTLREHFYLYLVGNLRSDLAAAQPFIRTIKNPFEQIAADIHVAKSVQKKVQLAVHEFREAEHLDLTVRPSARTSQLSAGFQGEPPSSGGPAA